MEVLKIQKLSMAKGRFPNPRRVRKPWWVPRFLNPRRVRKPGHFFTPPWAGRDYQISSAYRSQERETQLAKAELQSQICEKGSRGHPLTEEQKKNHRNKSKVRARIEHIFGAQNQMGGHFVRTLGRARATTKIGMMNLVYNMKRLVQLLKREAKKKNVCGSSSGELAGAPA